jgi:hypothetical protein
MNWYAIFMIIGMILVGGGWLVYWLHERKLDKEEANRPKPRSERLQKTHSELSDWAKKMGEYKGPALPPKKHIDHDKTQNG